LYTDDLNQKSGDNEKRSKEEIDQIVLEIDSFNKDPEL